MPARFSRRDHSALTCISLAAVLYAASTLASAQTITDFAVPTAPPTDSYGIADETPLCVPDEHTLCLYNNRFAVIAGWQETPLGPLTQAHAVSLTGESGYFWFLEPGNIEVVVKILNACVDPWNAYWVFAAGLTNLGVTIDVTDMQTGTHQTYTNLLGTPFQPILDVSALKTCP